MKKTIIILALSVFAAIGAQAQTIQWRGEDRTGIYKEPNLLKSWSSNGPEMLWHFNGLGEGHSSVAIANEKIYITGLTVDKGILYVFDLNGKLLNKKEYGGEWNTSYNGSRGTVTANEGKLYIISGTGDLVCLDEKTLNLVWKKNIFKDFDSKNITWGINESPLIINEKLIVTPGGAKNNVVALNKTTGTLIWSCAGEGDLSAYCSPLYISDQETPQVVTMTANHILGIDVATGKKLWSFEQKNRHAVHANTPVYGDNMILCTSGYGKGSTMLRLTNGGRNVEKVWETSELDSRMGGIVKIGDYAYGSGDANRYWFCYNWKTGEQMYKEKLPGTGSVTIAANNMLYCYSDKGEIILAKATPEKFDVVSRFSITLGTDQHWAHPVIYKGILYVRHGDALMAYKIS
ncbi:MAG: PQQ-like beta-propeller repeat protein [Prevotellaceae bacterium]|jgi:outer membrane protein assembly factor BamB|nr:PQQ-like beta-propeller repeat protein [Prevotellaceae bacterium]